MGDSAWPNAAGSFALSGSGDNVMIYCLDSDASVRFIFAALYQNDWSRETADPSSFSTNESARPGCLPHNCALSLPNEKKNWWYTGPHSGIKSELLDSNFGSKKLG